MEFFKKLVNLGSSVHWTFSIRIDAEGNINASAMVSPLDVKDRDKIDLPPINLKKSTADELDIGFFQVVRQPVTAAVELFQNQRQFEATLEASKKKQKDTQDAASKKKEEQSKAEQQKKEPDAKTKRFEEIMNKVRLLEGDGKIGQAIAQLPKITEFPGFKEQIETRTKELRKKHGSLSLFEEAAPEPTPPAAAAPAHEDDGDPEDPGELDEEPDESQEEPAQMEQ